MQQLLLFQDVQIKITYWAHPFNKQGYHIENLMQKFEETIPEHRLKDMLWQLEICECVNVKWQPIK
jgi:hypothetical protein